MTPFCLNDDPTTFDVTDRSLSNYELGRQIFVSFFEFHFSFTNVNCVANTSWHINHWYLSIANSALRPPTRVGFGQSSPQCYAARYEPWQNRVAHFEWRISALGHLHFCSFALGQL